MICPRCKQERERYKTQCYCKQCCYETQRDWAKDNRQRKCDINRAWRKRNAERRRVMNNASQAIFQAIRNGTLERGKSCAFCQASKDIEADHTDYGKPLEVIWLCRRCHRQWDAINPKSKNSTPEKI